MTTPADEAPRRQPMPSMLPVKGSPGEGPPPGVGIPLVHAAAWAGQVFIFLVGGVFFLLPERTFDFFVGKAPPEGEPVRLAHDLFAQIGSHAMGVGVLTVFALLAGSPEVRRSYARIFSLFLALWLAALLSNLYQSPELYGPSSHALVPVSGAMLLVNLWYAARKLPDDRLQIPFGEVASAPGWTWFALVAQGAVAVVLGVIALATPRLTLRLWMHDPAEVTTLAVQQYRFTTAYLLCHAAVSFFCATITNVRAWRAVSATLALWPLVACAIAVARGGTDFYTPWAYLALVPFVGFGLVSIAISRAAANQWSSDVSIISPGWSPIDLAAGPMMAVQTTVTRRRASHLRGVGARGVFRTVATPAEGAPRNNFFDPGREMPCVLRFANLTEADDASLDVRGAALSVSDPVRARRFDMVMNTGSSAPVRDVIDFAAFVASKFLPTWGSKLIVKRDRGKREGGITGLRRAPDSFTRLHFYGQIVRWWFDEKGALSLVRYRLVPEDPTLPESGLPDLDDASHIWQRDRRAGDPRPTDYLRKELRTRLAPAAGSTASPHVRMRFQAQFQTDVPGLSLDWYDASVDWPESTHPWHDLGVVDLDEALDDAVTETLGFWTGYHPPTLGVPPSDSLTDPRSLGDSEVRVMRALQQLRAWLDDRLGPPPTGAPR